MIQVQALQGGGAVVQGGGQEARRKGACRVHALTCILQQACINAAGLLKRAAQPRAARAPLSKVAGHGRSAASMLHACTCNMCRAWRWWAQWTATWTPTSRCARRTASTDIRISRSAGGGRRACAYRVCVRFTPQLVCAGRAWWQAACTRACTWTSNGGCKLSAALFKFGKASDLQCRPMHFWFQASRLPPHGFAPAAVVVQFFGTERMRNQYTKKKTKEVVDYDGGQHSVACPHPACGPCMRAGLHASPWVSWWCVGRLCMQPARQWNACKPLP